MDQPLAAVCGLYCGACGLYRAMHDDNPQRLKETVRTTAEKWGVPEDEVGCDGCLGGKKLTPYCENCRLRRCAEGKEAVARCADCPDFPCHKITDFNNDGARHHAEALSNLEDMQKIGVGEWVVKQEKKWRCPGCGIPVDWYASSCHSCGDPQPDRLPRLSRDEE